MLHGSRSLRVEGEMMASMFRQDSPYNTVMSALGDLAILNICWIISCIPLVTIGAADTALYTQIDQLQTGRGSHMIRHFFRGLIKNKLRSFKLTIVMVSLVFLTGFDLWYFSNGMIGSDLSSLAYGIVATTSFVLMAAGSFVFPLAARSDAKAMQLITASARLALLHPLYACAITALKLLPLILVIVAPDALPVIGIVWSVAGTGVTAYITNAILLRVAPRPAP